MMVIVMLSPTLPRGTPDGHYINLAVSTTPGGLSSQDHSVSFTDSRLPPVLASHSIIDDNIGLYNDIDMEHHFTRKEITIRMHDVLTMDRFAETMATKMKPEYLIDAEDIEIFKDEILGGGHFGTVYAGEHSGAPVAIKKMTSCDTTTYLEEGEIFFQKSNHYNICRCYGIYLDELDKRPFIVMELFKNGSLLDVCQDSDIFLSIGQKVHLCSQLTKGLCHLHKAGVVHADLGLRNCLIDLDHFRVAITDFGLSQTVTKPRRLIYVASRWASPEIFHSHIPTQASDIWSIGIVFIEIFTDGAQPYAGLTSSEVVRQLRSGKLKPTPNTTNDILDALLLKHFEPKEVRWKAKEMMQAWRKESKDHRNADSHRDSSGPSPRRSRTLS